MNPGSDNLLWLLSIANSRSPEDAGNVTLAGEGESKVGSVKWAGVRTAGAGGGPGSNPAFAKLGCLESIVGRRTSV